MTQGSEPYLQFEQEGEGQNFTLSSLLLTWLVVLLHTAGESGIVRRKPYSNLRQCTYFAVLIFTIGLAANTVRY